MEGLPNWNPFADDADSIADDAMFGQEFDRLRCGSQSSELLVDYLPIHLSLLSICPVRLSSLSVCLYCPYISIICLPHPSVSMVHLLPPSVCLPHPSVSAVHKSRASAFSVCLSLQPVCHCLSIFPRHSKCEEPRRFGNDGERFA